MELKDFENTLYKKSEHKEITYKPFLGRKEGPPIPCNICESPKIQGIRYFCIQCPNFNMCSNCDSIIIHEHPLMKLRTSEDIVNFAKCLQNRQKESIEENKEDEFGSDFYIPQAKVNQSFIEKQQNKFYLEESEKYSDENLRNCQAVCTNMMPPLDYTINTISSDICLTVTLKNTGNIAWPKGFKVWSDQAEVGGK